MRDDKFPFQREWEEYRRLRNKDLIIFSLPFLIGGLVKMYEFTGRDQRTYWNSIYFIHGLGHCVSLRKK